ncbi:MAG: Flp pilus assembly protein CpaB [Acidimicrobiales bacterium]
MSRRILGLLTAVVLALVGTFALVAFVTKAEARALEGEELVEVYVVSEPIPSGTPGKEIEESIVVEQVPAKVRALGAVESLPSVVGKVAAVDLQPGEQLIDSRFVDLSEFADRAAGVQIPEDMIEVTLELDPQRAVGGLLEPGQTVAVLASFEPFEVAATVVEVDGVEIGLPDVVAAEIDGQTPNATDLLLRKVIVTAVQEARTRSFNTDEEEFDRLNTSPEDVVLVTLAVPPADAERLVFTAEFGFVWLAVERDTVPEVEDEIRTRGNIYENDLDGSRVELR